MAFLSSRRDFFPYLVAGFPLVFPLYLFRGELLGVPVTLPEVLLFFLFIFFLIREEAWRVTWWVKQGQKWRLWPFWCFLLAGCLGVLVAPEVSSFLDGREFAARSRAIGILKGWILAPMVYAFMARTIFYEKPSLIPWALRSLLAGGVVLSLHALHQVVTGEFLTLDGRASGPFESANYLSLYLGPLVVYAFSAAFQEREENIYNRILLALGGVICLLALYFTESYASWIAVSVAFSVGALLHVRRKSPKTFAAFLVATFCLGVLAIALQWGSEKFTQFFELTERSSSSVRIQVYTVALNLIMDHPLLGIGLGQFEQFYQVNVAEILGRDPYEWNMLHSHNIFLALWLNMGVLGLVAFFALSWRSLAWLMERDKKERRIAALMLLTILVHGLFDTPYFKNDLSFEFWLLLAILL